MSRSRSAAPRVEAEGESFMQRLRMDHAGLSRLLRVIDTQQSLLRTDPESSRPLLVEALRYLLQYQHAFHHPREDRLFASIRQRAPHLYRDMRRLVREHRIGQRRAEQLAAGLGCATTDQLLGRQGARLSQGLRDYVRHTRNHMRREEAVFFARSEHVLDASDWLALGAGDSTRDPLSDLSRLAVEYPLLAACLDRPVREIGGEGAAASPSRPGHALRHSLEQLFEVYGELLHDALDLARANFDSLRRIRSPADIMRAARPMHSRNCRFAGRCVTQPARWMRETAGAILTSSWARNTTGH